MAKSLNDDILSCGSTDSSWMENIVLAPEDMAIILKALDNNKVIVQTKSLLAYLQKLRHNCSITVYYLTSKLSTSVMPRDLETRERCSCP